MPDVASLTAIVGQKVLSANSSLKNFSMRLEGTGLSLDAVAGPAIDARLVPINQLSAEKEAVCAVDWSWILQSTVKNILVQNSSVRLELDPAGPLVIAASNWQGSPFLSFQPYKAPAR
jgi:hypothetical protein